MVESSTKKVPYWWLLTTGFSDQLIKKALSSGSIYLVTSKLQVEIHMQSPQNLTYICPSRYIHRSWEKMQLQLSTFHIFLCWTRTKTDCCVLGNQEKNGGCKYQDNSLLINATVSYKGLPIRSQPALLLGEPSQTITGGSSSKVWM